MPPLERTDLLQQAVVFAFVREDRNGRFLTAPPVEVDCRFTNKRREVVDSKGNQIALDATITVADPLTVRSLVAPGTLSEFLGTGSGRAEQDYYVVTTEDVAPDIKNREVRYNYGLQRTRATKPDYA